jgi:hypothetical protein
MNGLDPAVGPAGGPSRLLATVAAVVLLAGCAGAEEPDEVTSTTPVPSEHSGPYTRDQRALYREAVRRVEAFEAANQPLLAAGRATRKAKRFYENHLRDWESAYAQLQEYEAEGVRVERGPIVLSTEPVTVQDFQDNAAEIVIRRCTDQSDLGMTRQGSPVPPRYDEPVVQEVTVVRSENRTWRIASFETTGEMCAG